MFDVAELTADDLHAYWKVLDHESRNEVFALMLARAQRTVQQLQQRKPVADKPKK